MAALLIDRNSSLAGWPEALKAIFLASSVNNVDGPNGIDPTQDLKDGAGSIDAYLADKIAPNGITDFYDTTVCNSPCWWDFAIDQSRLPPSQYAGDPNAYLYRYFRASQGESIRIAISWLSGVSNNPYSSSLDVDLDLTIYTVQNNGQLTPIQGVFSASSYNGFELIDFVAPDSPTGKYAIGVNNFNSPGNYSNYLGIAWTKTATYIPQFWSSTNGWDSTLYIRNDGALAKSVTVSIFNDAGTYMYGSTQTVNPNAVWSYNPSNNDATHYSAIVSGSEDISVVSVQRYIPYNSYAAFTVVSHPTTQDFVPLLHRNNSGYYSHIFIQNTTGATASVTVQFKQGTAGQDCTISNTSIPPNGRWVISTSSYSCLGSTFIGSAYISSNQPVAVMTTQYKGSTSVLQSSNDQNAALKAFAPLIQNNNSGWYSGFAEQNAYGSTQTLLALFYHAKDQGSYQNGNSCSSSSQSTAAYKSYLVNGSPGSSCATIASAEYYGASNGNVTVNVNQLLPGTNYATDYRAITAPGYVVTVPFLQMYNGSWFGGIAIRNTTTEQTEITIYLYDLSGNAISSPLTIALDSRETFICTPGVAPCFSNVSNTMGSAIITSTNSPIAVVANNLLLNASYDGLMTYEGIHR